MGGSILVCIIPSQQQPCHGLQAALGPGSPRSSNLPAGTQAKGLTTQRQEMQGLRKGQLDGGWC